METRWQVEIDDYATRVLEKHWPNVRRHRDVREVGAHNLEPVDVICGGFPCQDLSSVGRQSGFKGERSSLYREMLRVIGECLPRYALFENVSALLTGERGRWFAEFLYDLAAVGYDAEWHCVPASYVGAPHIRDRVWIIAYPNAAEGGERTFGEIFSHCKVPGGDFQREWRGAVPNISRMDDGISRRLDRLGCLGNAVVPDIPEIIGRAIMDNQINPNPRTRKEV